MQQEFFVSLRRDLAGRFGWAGLPLASDAVDLRFTLVRLRGYNRLIQAKLARPGHAALLDTRQAFDLEDLGRDYLNLESPEQEMLVISQYFEGISASCGEPDEPGVILLKVKVAGGCQRFRLSVGIESRWDWFLDPREASRGGVPLYIPRPICGVLPAAV